MQDVGSAASNMDIPVLKTTANDLYTHADNALTMSKEYKVSLGLQDAKWEYEAALSDYRNTGTYMVRGADRAYTDTDQATRDLEHALSYMTSGSGHLTHATDKIEEFNEGI